MSKGWKQIELIETCGACPEQYEAYLGSEEVGYLRLRHGYFRVDFPSHGGETIYDAYPEGDGIFTYEERPKYLKKAKKAIWKALKKRNKKDK